MAKINQHKVVASLPDPLEANSIYYVRVGAGFDQYVTNGSGMIVAYQSNAKLELDGKVDKEEGKVLSSNDYTTAEKNKLAGIEAGAQVNVATNIGQGSRTSTTIPLTSSTGTGTTLPSATTSLAGLQSAADKAKLDGIAAGATANATDAQLRDRATHTGVQPITSVEGLQDALDNKVDNTDPRMTNAREWTASVVTQAEAEAGTSTTARKWTAQRVRQAILGWWNTSTFKTKLDGIESGATKNATDAQLRDRATHTGVQPISSVDGLQSALDNKVDNDDVRLTNAREWTASLVSQTEAEAGTATTTRKWTALRVRQAILGWWNSSAEKTKLDGIATGATKNATDAQLRDRSTHTGTQAISTVNGLQTTLDAKVDKVTGMGLSEESFTTAEKNKLEGIEPGAQVNVGTNLTMGGSGNSRTITSSTGNSVSVPVATTSAAGFMSTTDKSKLDGLSNVNLIAGSNVSLSGAYPNITISSTNTTYSEIPESEVTTGTASTARAISARRLKFAIDTHGLKIGTTSTTAKAGNWTPSAADIPNLDASKITSGTLADARIPNLSAGKITSGTISNARLSGVYDGITLKLNGSNTVFTTPSSGSSNSSARTVYGLAEFRASASSTVGAIVFIAPNTTHTVMHEVEIAGLLYNNNIVRLTIQGYRSGASGNWTAMRKISTGTVDVPARWGLTPDGKACIILGDVDSTWSYPHFSIIRAMFSHSNVSDAYCSGWTTALVTDLTEYTRVTSFISDSAMVGSISGNAATATKLTTARTINGTSFNGTANITTANWGTARTLTIGATGKSVNGSANVSWSLSDIGAAAASHTHSLSDVSGLGNVAGISTNGSTANYLRGDGTWVTPPNTTYAEITTAEIDAGTASTARAISGRRMKYALDKKSDIGHGHAIGDVTGLQAAIDAKANTSTQVIAGTGLSGGGTLAANRTLSVIYGTTAGTAVQGNDSRLSDSREWTAGTVSQAEAEAGTATTRRAWTAQRVRQAAIAAMSTHVPGMGQTWQDLTADRSIGTIYTNTTGRPIYVSVVAYETGVTNWAFEVDGVQIGEVGAWESGSGTFSGVVPNGSTYRVYRRTGSSGTIRNWAELR